MQGYDNVHLASKGLVKIQSGASKPFSIPASLPRTASRPQRWLFQIKISSVVSPGIILLMQLVPMTTISKTKTSSVEIQRPSSTVIPRRSLHQLNREERRAFSLPTTGANSLLLSPTHSVWLYQLLHLRVSQGRLMSQSSVWIILIRRFE